MMLAAPSVHDSVARQDRMPNAYTNGHGAGATADSDWILPDQARRRRAVQFLAEQQSRLGDGLVGRQAALASGLQELRRLEELAKGESQALAEEEATVSQREKKLKSMENRCADEASARSNEIEALQGAVEARSHTVREAVAEYSGRIEDLEKSHRLLLVAESQEKQLTQAEQWLQEQWQEAEAQDAALRCTQGAWEVSVGHRCAAIFGGTGQDAAEKLVEAIRETVVERIREKLCAEDPSLDREVVEMLISLSLGGCPPTEMREPSLGMDWEDRASAVSTALGDGPPCDVSGSVESGLSESGMAVQIAPLPPQAESQALPSVSWLVDPFDPSPNRVAESQSQKQQRELIQQQQHWQSQRQRQRQKENGAAEDKSPRPWETKQQQQEELRGSEDATKEEEEEEWPEDLEQQPRYYDDDELSGIGQEKPMLVTQARSCPSTPIAMTPRTIQISARTPPSSSSKPRDPAMSPLSDPGGVLVGEAPHSSSSSAIGMLSPQSQWKLKAFAGSERSPHHTMPSQGPMPRRAQQQTQHSVLHRGAGTNGASPVLRPMPMTGQRILPGAPVVGAFPRW